ncbi:M12 family metallopeptidase [Bacillus mycoides]|uniref:M12 family metallopeptidase n=1 Tax=Bacillus mycoides TaxID=1405 RepID=UPI001F2D47E3|nr:M12 family metallopeptidase [Bacillus mycoides]
MSEEIKICIDRILPQDMHEEARENAIAENTENNIIGLRNADLPEEIAVLTGKKWGKGRTLRVRFLDGVPDVQKRVEHYAHEWEKYANIKFIFGNDPDAEIRISFKHDHGSWSYIGTDCLSIPKTEPTMNFGWLKSDTPDDEYSRVVLHEFGHALGCIHEHQNPAAKIPWDKEAVYRVFMGPPNNWTKEQIDQNLFKRYSKTETNFTQFDKNSIMLYAIPNTLTIGDFEVGSNRVLSNMDKEFMKNIYPKK